MASDGAACACACGHTRPSAWPQLDAVREGIRKRAMFGAAAAHAVFSAFLDVVSTIPSCACACACISTASVSIPPSCRCVCMRVADLHTLAREFASYAASVSPTERSGANAALRVVKICSDEAARVGVTVTPAEEGMASVKAAMSAAIAAARNVASAPNVDHTRKSHIHISSMKEPLMDALTEACDECEAPEDAMRASLRACVDEHDVVMVTGHSSAIARAVKALHQELYVTDGPSAAEIMRSRSKVAQFIPLASTGAVMHRVSKLVLEGVAVATNGDVVVAAGGFGLASAAAAAGARVIIAAHTLALSPVTTASLAVDVELSSPGAVLPFQEVQLHAGHLHVFAGKYDALPASLISVIVTDAQTLRPSNVAAAVEELYGSPSEAAA